MHAFSRHSSVYTKGLAVECVSAQMTGVPPKTTHWPKILVLLILVIGAAVLSRHLSRDQALALMERARNIGWPGYLAFVIAYAVLCACGLPASIPNLAAAVTFGFWRTLPLVLVGANCAGILALLLSRYFARDWFTQIAGKRLPIAQFDRAVAESGWRIVTLTRIPPISPFAIVSYAYGLTSVRLSDYVIGTAIGIIPGTTAYVYLGSILGNVATASNRTRTPLEWSLYICGFLATVGVCIYIVRVAKTALAGHAIKE